MQFDLFAGVGFVYGLSTKQHDINLLLYNPQAGSKGFPQSSQPKAIKAIS